MSANKSEMDRRTLQTRIDSNRVQLNLPDLDGPIAAAKFVILNQKNPLQYPRTPEDVRQNLLAIALSLCRHEKHAYVWRANYKKTKVHPIAFLISRIVGDSLRSDARPVVTEIIRSPLNLTLSSSSVLDMDMSNLPDLQHEDFEYLYYAILCKITELYYDLQVRFVCGFVTLDELLHIRGIDCRRNNEPCTVRDFRNFVCLAWHLLHDDTFQFRMNEAIKTRKIAIVNATMSPPVGLLTPPQSAKGCPARSSLGTSVVRSTTRGLQSLDNPASLMDLITKKYHLGSYDCALLSPVSSTTHLEPFMDPVDMTMMRQMDNDSTSALDPCSAGRGGLPSIVLSSCQKSCDCQMVCSKRSDPCVCRSRPHAFQASPTHLAPKYRLRSPPQFKYDQQSHQSLQSDSGIPRPSVSLKCLPVSPSRPARSNSKLTAVKSPSAPVLLARTPSVPSRTTSKSPNTRKELSPAKTSPGTVSPVRLSLPPTPPTKLGRSSVSGQQDLRHIYHGRAKSHNVQLSYRVPFEDNQFFLSSPLLSMSPPNRKVRYVSAGGNLPMNQRPPVELPSSEEAAVDPGFRMPRERLFEALPETPQALKASNEMGKGRRLNASSRFKDRINRMFDR